MIYVVGTESCWLRGSRQPFVKIGVTIDLRQRLAKISTDNPHAVKAHYLFEGGEERERELQGLFQRWHYRNEWFRTWVGQYPLKPEIEGEWFLTELPEIIKNRGVVS